MVIAGQSVTVNRTPREKEPGYTISTFTDAMQKEYISEYRKKYPIEHYAGAVPSLFRNSRRPKAIPTATTTFTTSSTRCAVASPLSKTQPLDSAQPALPCSAI